ncbi:hypothetical protein ACFXI6_14480 [Streptomyces mirabilis]|uniref:hypothetical protein n=1 Tax=Streptomyces mirabilis TaxID=68239 RepID=UPI0036AC1B7E
MDIRPQDLPELRAELLAHVASHRGEAQFRQRFAGPLCTSEGEMTAAFPAEDFQSEEVRRLGAGELFFVSDEMTDLAATAAESVPFFDLEIPDLPAPAGLMVFAKPFALYQDEGKPPAQLRACCWTVEGTALWFTFYSDWHSWLTDCRGAGVFGADEVDYCLKADHWLYPETFIFSPLTHTPQPEGPYEEHGREVASVERVVRSTWLIMQQQLVMEETAEPDRAARKRLRRAGHEPAPVRVIELRRPKTTSGIGDSDREYHHQWIVRGHWRQQWHPKRQVHRPVWIAPHIKGPEGAPLIGGEKVYALKR